MSKNDLKSNKHQKNLIIHIHMLMKQICGQESIV